ncbi:hypothetical protein [Crateriforma conspicua]|nr:hypothetical protein [Crateriforma conspicua]QDV61343.1 hypothetical protein Mal65_04660 [Crateriforma conspicua]
MMFPEWFLQVLVIGGLVLCGAGTAALIVLLWFDKKNRQIW